jgi:hypothetical protein
LLRQLPGEILGKLDRFCDAAHTAW